MRWSITSGWATRGGAADPGAGGPRRPPQLGMRCKPRTRLAPHTASVLRSERVKAKPCGRFAALTRCSTVLHDAKEAAKERTSTIAYARARRPECASKQKNIDSRERVFFISAQALEAPSKNAIAYDGCTSGAIIYAYVGGNPLNNIDPNGLLSLSDVAGVVSDATGGCSSNSFGDDVVNNFVDVQDSTSLLKIGTSLALGGAFAKQYGGLTVGGAAMGLVREMRSGYTVTGIGSRTFLQAAATAGATWAANSVLIKGSYDAGVLAGSILRTGINRAASSAACTCQK